MKNYLLISLIFVNLLFGCQATNPKDSIQEAVESGNELALKEALKSGAWDEMALNASVLDGQLSITRILLKHAHKEGHPWHSGELVGLAMHQGHADVVALLLEHGADPNQRDLDGGFPLSSGCLKPGQSAVIKLLLEAGADVKLTSQSLGEVTALHHASLWGDPEMLTLLIEAGAEVDARTETGLTPLMMAARHDNLDNLKTLLKAGADVAARDENGATALIWSAKRKSKECEKELERVTQSKS